MSASKQSLWRSLGQMFGNIAAGIASDPANPPARLRDDAADPRAASSPHAPPIAAAPPAPPAPQSAARSAGNPPAQVVSASVQEQVVQTPEGPVRLRRTVIDEVVPPIPGQGTPGPRPKP